MNEAVNSTFDLQTYMPYIVSVLCALISAVANCYIKRKRARPDTNKLKKRFRLDLKKSRHPFGIEKEKIKIEYSCQSKLKQKELDGTIANSLISSTYDRGYEKS